MSTGLTDPDSLRSDQYKDSTKLSARADLHQFFSTNPTGWQIWVYNQFDFPEKPRILELGSGPGYLWQQNHTRFQEDWDICLSDISQGMLQEATAHLKQFAMFRYAVLNICDIPFPENSFDAVIANHMLYHVPDLPAALKEIERVLKPSSCLYAATNGGSHLQEIRDWKTQFFPERESPDWGTATLGFSIENGEALLLRDFKNVHFLEYPDRLQIDQVEPIISYIRSYSKLEEYESETKQLREYIKNQIALNGSIQITKESGMFVASKR